jgi:hypothetical protein
MKKWNYTWPYPRCGQTRYSSREEANKVYQLLRINDPELNVRILKH